MNSKHPTTHSQQQTNLKISTGTGAGTKGKEPPSTSPCSFFLTNRTNEQFPPGYDCLQDDCI